MKIARVELAPFRLPLVTSLQTGAGMLQARDGFAIRVTNSEGAIGIGESTPLASQGTESLELCERALREDAGSLVGARLDSIDDVTALLAFWTGTPAARCGLELALLELLARARKIPVAELLSKSSSEVPVNALLIGRTVEALAAESRRRVSEGFGTLKFKVGARSLDVDLARLGAIRDAAGPEIALRIDANGAWSLTEARRALAALAAVTAIVLCEQPVKGLDDLAELALTSPIPLAADELLARLEVADEVISRRAAHALILKPMVLGGIVSAFDLGVRAHRADLEVIVTTCLDGAIARAGALHLACALPGPLPACGLATGSALERDLAPDPIRLIQGRAVSPTEPGYGLELNAPLGWSRVG